MALTLQNFKQTIPSNILTRGRDYYHNGHVTDLSQEGDEAWTAEVQGTERYEVVVTQHPDGSLECSCTCPYEYGEHCKHVAAALYAIEEAFPEYLKGGRRKPARKRATRMDRLRAALRAVSLEQLIGVLLELAEDDRDLQTQLLLRLDAGHKPTDYRRLVKDTLRPLRSNDGFVDYGVAARVSKQLNEVFSRAGQAISTRPDDALTIYQILLEETIDLGGRIDDSYGVLSDAISLALAGVDMCAERVSPDGRAALFAYCLREAGEPRQREGGYAWNLLKLAANLVTTSAQRSALFETLDVVVRDRAKTTTAGVYWSDYLVERAAEVKLMVVQRLDGDEATLAFISDHRHLPRFRKLLIEFYISREDLTMARKLAEEGLAAIGKGNTRHGLALDYRDLILLIAQRQGDTQATIEHARALWLNRRGEAYYDLLTDVVPPEKWPAFRESLLNDRNCTSDLAAWAYAREGLWAKVRDIAVANRRLMMQYQLEMEARFPNETAAAYRRIVENMLSDVSNRLTYSEAADYLVRMQKLGYGDEGRALALFFIEKYPQRRAMIEELKRAAG